MLTGGQVAVSLAVFVLSFVSFINVFNIFDLVTFFAIVYLLLLSALLIAAAIFRFSFLSKYFGFLSCYAGCGVLMVVVGTNSLGIYEIWGQIVGGISIAWMGCARDCRALRLLSGRVDHADGLNSCAVGSMRYWRL